jgi:PPM family protein phosphatase
MLRVAEEFHATHTGRQRRANEDSLFARAPLFAVADGMGGAQAGEIASRIAVDTLGAGVGDGAPEEQLAELIRRANDRIHDLSQSDERRAGMGTTVTAVLIGEEEVTIAHVGDSRAYLLRDGSMSRLTRDHSLVEELLAQGRLTPEEASQHPQRSVITRAVGPEATVEVDTQTARVRAGDVLLLCSDGLTSMVGEDQVERTVAGASSLEAAGRALIDAANEAGGRDNITVVLLRLEEIEGAGPAEREQDTVAGRDALRTGDVQAALEAEQRRAGREGSDDGAAPASARRLQPLRTGGQAGAPGRGTRRPRLRRALIVAAVVGLVGVPVALGSLVAVRAVFFVGTNEQGFVTVYRGLPYELPLGIDLYQENYVSAIPDTEVPAGRREAVTSQELRSQEDAYDLVRRLELGQIQGTR